MQNRRSLEDSVEWAGKEYLGAQNGTAAFQQQRAIPYKQRTYCKKNKTLK